MSNVEQGSDKSNLTKKKVDTENLDLGSETPVERMEIVLPGAEDLHLKNAELHGGVSIDDLDNSLSVSAPSHHSTSANIDPSIDDVDQLAGNSTDFSQTTPSVTAPIGRDNIETFDFDLGEVPSIELENIDLVGDRASAPAQNEISSFNPQSQSVGPQLQPAEVAQDPIQSDQPTNVSQPTPKDTSDPTPKNTTPVDIELDNNTVDENSTSGVIVATLSTSDADEGDTHTYAITNDPSGNFEIVGDEIRVKNGANIDYEVDVSHDIIIEVTDAGGNTYSETVTINVADINEQDVSPISDIDGTENVIAEDASIGASVGITANAVDGDGSNNTVTYTLSDDADGLFTIDANTGEVTVADSLDFESDQNHDIEVTATSSDGSTSTQVYTVNVANVNEADISSISDSNVTSNGVDENASIGDVVGITAVATDGDVTDNVTYSLSDDAGGLFTIDANTGVVTTTGSLDAETASSYDIEVTATSTDGSTSAQTYTVNVNDQDEFDISATTDTDASANTLAENASAGDSVGITASATDGDATNSGVTYSVDDSRFTVDADGTVKVATGASFDAESEGSVDIIVTSTSDDGSSSSETFTIAVSDIDEVDVGSISDSNAGANEVAENAGSGADVGITASASDGDVTDTISYSLSDDAGGLFTIDANTGVVTTTGSLDAETASSYDIEVTATSTDGSTSAQTYTVNVNDQDEFDISATTDTDASANTLAENASAGDSVGITASATDGDATNSGVTYSVDDSRFTVDADGTVKVATGASFDAESEGSVDIIVTSTSDDGSSSSETFTIAVSDIDEVDVGSISDSNAGANEVAENAGSGADVGITASASDGDVTDTISYSLSDDAGGLFTIDANTGVVTTTGSLDAETASSYDIEVTATSTDGSTSAQTYTVNVNDQDEFDISAIADSNVTSNGVDEDASIGDVVGITAIASDDDATDNVTYSLSDDAGGLFTIDANTGVVTIAGSLDAETATSHNIEVTATSDDSSTSTQVFTIGVNDVNETSITAISDSDGSGNSVSEGASIGTAVGVTALATDADATDNVSYSLSSNPGGFFAIDANTGVVTVASGLDYETDTAHTIQVTAISDDGTSTSQDFTIAVDDVNEAPTDITFGGNADLDITTTAGTSEDAVVTGEILSSGGNTSVDHWAISHNGGNLTIDVFADGYNGGDLDTSLILYRDNGEGTYTQVASNDDGSAGSDGSSSFYDSYISVSGLSAGDYIVAVGSLDMSGSSAQSTSSDYPTTGYDDSYEDGPYQLTISGDATVSYADNPDYGGSWGDPGNNAVVVSDGIGTEATETISAGSIVGNVETVVDIDAGDTFTFALTDDAAGKFEIDANTGDIKLVAEHDASTAYSDTVDVQVTDAGGNTYVETVGIQLGTDNAETLTGTANTDIIHGFGGQDTLNGGAGDDVLIAGDGDGGSGGIVTGADLITNGGFENTSTGWTLNSGPEFQYYSNGSNGVSTTEGNYYLDMDAAPGNVDIQQVVSGLSTGTSYQLSFDTAQVSSFDASVEVYWNGELLETITSNSGTMSSNNYTVEAGAGDGSDTVRFVEIGSVDYGGTALDNVQLFEMTAVTNNGDVLNGGDGNDILISGSGADTFDGGNGTDTVDYSNATAGVDVAFQDTDDSGSGGVMEEVFAGGHAGEAEGDTYTSIENFVGTDYADNVYGGSSDMSFQLGAGDDHFDTGANSAVDTVDGGAGSDEIWAGGGNDILTGGAGSDAIFGEDGNDIMSGGADDDYSYGDGGDDIFIFGEGDGADTIEGGAGGGWTDTIQLSDAGGDIGAYGVDWTVSLTSSTIDSQNADSLTLSDDASGLITLSDGSTVDFYEIERIEF